MKAFTDIEQSKQLVEIPPIESKVYVVFQQGSFNPRHEEKRIKGVFSSYQKAEECISNLSYGDTHFSIICFELDKKPNYFNSI